MAEARVTKVVCPSCEGTGRFGKSSILEIACMWCRGEIRVPVETAHRYADHIWMIAGGGFVCGDHDYKHKVEMERKAEGIYTLTGNVAPWKASTEPKGA